MKLKKKGDFLHFILLLYIFIHCISILLLYIFIYYISILLLYIFIHYISILLLYIFIHYISIFSSLQQIFGFPKLISCAYFCQAFLFIFENGRC